MFCWFGTNQTSNSHEAWLVVINALMAMLYSCPELRMGYRYFLVIFLLVVGSLSFGACFLEDTAFTGLRSGPNCKALLAGPKVLLRSFSSGGY